MFTIGFWFWILYVIGLLVYGVGVWRSRRFDSVDTNNLFWWVLLALLGCGVFGYPLR
jgi:hypothetical protein